MDIVKIKKNQVDMLSTRGYTIPEEESNITKKTPLNNTYFYDDKEELYVHYCITDKLVDCLKTFVKKLELLPNGIFISTAKNIADLSKKTYKEYFDALKLKNIQLFTFEELSYNITTNIYSPEYTKIDPSFIIPTIANKNQLPVLLLDDPIVKYYDFRPGDVIRVTDNLDVDIVNTINISYCIVVSYSK